jgi:hypothetical protein
MVSVAMGEEATVAAGGRLCRPGGQARAARSRAGGGGSWGNQGFPPVLWELNA